ncbi:MAG: 50S ribosomal protein L29 [Candidatus Zixiibacteriota bacterium]
MEKLGTDRLREMSHAELSRELRDLEEELFNLRVRRSLQPPDNPLLLRQLRRQVARVKTVMTQQASGARGTVSGSGAGDRS